MMQQDILASVMLVISFNLRMSYVNVLPALFF